jgi:hypothetical protein
MSYNHPKVKSNFLYSHWTEFYNPRVVLEACGNAKRMVMDMGRSVRNPANMFKIALWPRW